MCSACLAPNHQLQPGPDLVDRTDLHVDELHREHREKALKELERLSEAHFGDLDRRTVVVDGPPARAIVHYASEHSVDLIVMADSGLHGLRGTLLGSVCQRVLLRAPCPVLVVPKSLPGTPSP